ncbi:MAG: RlmE family RNA methyltransferase [SAR324 cluster bacterium]|nr:RlmE family RNA methyltransferase [SAR324 cluster bacterium]
MKKIKDHYYHQAKKEGYVARSAYKLEEIDKKHQLLRKGYFVLDLGCSPGSWLQYASKKVGPKGLVQGVDLQPVKLSLPSQVKVLQADIFDLTAKDLDMDGKPFDVIISDMAPKTSGIRSADAQRSLALNQQVLDLAGDLLRPQGSLLVKAFQGAPLDELRSTFRVSFSKVKLCKPKSSRAESVEIFLLGQGKN